MKASFADFGENGSSFVAAGGAYAFPACTMAQDLEAVIVQKWASFAYGVHFIEGWFERNRTGLPKSSSVYSTDPSYVPGQLVVSKNSTLAQGQYPKRLVFPDAEISTNPNTQAQVPITPPVGGGKSF